MKYQDIVPLYYKNAHAIILMYSVNDPVKPPFPTPSFPFSFLTSSFHHQETFSAVRKYWEMVHAVGSDFIYALVGSKKDLPGNTQLTAEVTEFVADHRLLLTLPLFQFPFN